MLKSIILAIYKYPFFISLEVETKLAINPLTRTILIRVIIVLLDGVLTIILIVPKASIGY